MTAKRPRERSDTVNVDGYDKIEVSSIDSFPASDPPGWIEATARPREERVPEHKRVRPHPKRARG